MPIISQFSLRNVRGKVETSRVDRDTLIESRPRSSFSRFFSQIYIKLVKVSLDSKLSSGTRFSDCDPLAARVVVSIYSRLFLIARNGLLIFFFFSPPLVEYIERGISEYLEIKITGNKFERGRNAILCRDVFQISPSFLSFSK